MLIRLLCVFALILPMTGQATDMPVTTYEDEPVDLPVPIETDEPADVPAPNPADEPPDLPMPAPVEKSPAPRKPAPVEQPPVLPKPAPSKKPPAPSKPVQADKPAGLSVIPRTQQANQLIDLVEVNDFTVTNLHFAIFNAKNRKNPDIQNQGAMLEELVSTFMLANSAEGKKLAGHPEIAAAMEVNNARLVAQTMINERLKNTRVSDAEIRDLYQKRYANGPNTEYKARHILLSTKQAADAVIAELNKGANFTALATQKSIGPTKKTGGDLGWFTPGQMVKPFADAVARLKNGTYTKQAVQTQFGWHVILREDAKTVPVPALADVREKVVDAVKRQKLSRFIQGIRDKSAIDILADPGN